MRRADAGASTSSAGPRSPPKPSRSIGRPSRSTGADTRYADRTAAGRRLAELVGPLGDDALVLGLPRGGIPVAAPIAAGCGLGLHPLAVRKLGAPGRPELAMGAVAAIGDRVEVFRNEAIVRQLGVDEERFARIRDREVAELLRSVARFGGTPPLEGRHVIIVDDGLATGATMLAAVQVVATTDPGRITVVVPVAARQAVALIGAQADVICPQTPDPFIAVGQAYDDFAQVTDAEVRHLLDECALGGLAP